MNQLVLFLATGMLLLALLLFWALRARESVTGARALLDPRETLTALELELPPRVLVERIFSPQDWEFVSRQTPVPIRITFLQERRTIALSWLRQTRKQAARLMDFHRRAVRWNTNLSPAIEIKLAANYILFLLVCEILLGLIWLRGPFHARRMIGYAIGIAERLWFISGQLLAGLDPARLSRIKAVWTKRSVAS
jgi:hypothetical protein